MKNQMIISKRLGMLFFVCIILVASFASVALADSTRGITDTSVTVGLNYPLSRVLAHAGKASLDATKTYFEYINKERGGVHGRKIKIVVADHQYEPSLSLGNFKKLATRDEVMAVFAWGTPPVTILKDPANDEKMPMFCFSGGTSLFNPPSRYVIAMITPYSIQAASVVTYIVERLGNKKPKIGIFYNNDDFGRAGKEGVELAAKHYGIEILHTAPHITGNPVASSAVTGFKQAGVDYLLVAAHSGDVSSLLLELKNQSLNCEVYGVLSPASDRKIVEQAKDAAVKYHSIDSQGRWTDTESQGIANMIALTKKYGIKEDLEAKSYYYILGWYPAVFFVEALERAGKDLTVEKFVDALNTFNNWDSKGVAPPLTVSEKQKAASLGSIMLKADLKKMDLLPVPGGWIKPPDAIIRKILGN